MSDDTNEQMTPLRIDIAELLSSPQVRACILALGADIMHLKKLGLSDEDISSLLEAKAKESITGHRGAVSEALNRIFPPTPIPEDMRGE